MSIVRTTDTGIPGCLLLTSKVHEDERGRFVKYFHQTSYLECGLPAKFPEHFYSASRQGVLRGLHFQVPPKDHDKIVVCIQGRVQDVVLDLRVGSPRFQEHEQFRLDGAHGTGLFIPRGCAHGFLALTDDVLLVYLVSTEHSPEHDTGVRWDSARIEWAIDRPVVSQRDADLPPLHGFSSPFTFRGNGV